MRDSTGEHDPEDAGPLGTRLRVGTIRRCVANPKARRPAYELQIDFGPHGVRTSSAQLTENHHPDGLGGRQVLVSTDLGVKRIAGLRSEVLVLGLPGSDGSIVLVGPDRAVPDGGLLH